MADDARIEAPVDTPVDGDGTHQGDRTHGRAGGAGAIASFIAVPWIGRRLRGESSGDGVEPKRPDLLPLG